MIDSQSEPKSFSQDIINEKLPEPKVKLIPHARVRKPRSRSPKQTQFLSSMTGVNPMRTHGLGLWGNERVVFGVRVDKQLAKSFTLASKALFGSTCNPIESYMAAVVGWWQNPQLVRVNPSLTIGEIRIERNLRERRKVTETEVEMTETVVAKKVEPKPKVERIKVDYSKLSLEKLNDLHERAGKNGDLGKQIVIAAELKRRGVLNGTQ